MPTERTVGMSVTVHTPWEGQTGYATMMVFRYQGLVPGDRIGFNRARTMKKASGCWAGADKTGKARCASRCAELNVAGVHERVPGQIALGADDAGLAAGRSTPSTAACWVART